MKTKVLQTAQSIEKMLKIEDTCLIREIDWDMEAPMDI